MKIDIESMKRFKFHERFTTMDIEKFPNGWILRTDLPKYSDPSVSPVSYSNLINNIIFVDPGIWGDDELEREYWKQNTYHPSLSKMNLDHVKKNVIFIGKIIKKKPKQKKQKKIYYDTLLMINSAHQYNEFDQKQCKEMMTVINSMVPGACNCVQNGSKFVHGLFLLPKRQQKQFY